MHVMIIGGGEVGSHLAGLLLHQDHRVTVVETHEGALAELRRTAPGAQSVHGSGTDPWTLEAAGIRTADVVAAVTGSDESNLVVANLARFVFASPRVAARINNPRHSWMFTATMGVDVALDQADLLAHLITQTLERR
jgi:trk system potassium uptake protein TrkA